MTAGPSLDSERLDAALEEADIPRRLTLPASEGTLARIELSERIDAAFVPADETDSPNLIRSPRPPLPRCGWAELLGGWIGEHDDPERHAPASTRSSLMASVLRVSKPASLLFGSAGPNKAMLRRAAPGSWRAVCVMPS